MARKRRVRLLELLISHYPQYSRDQLTAFIVCRNVVVNNEISTDPKSLWHEDATVELQFESTVSRGATKLEHALVSWNLDVTDLVLLDAGSSTGGFTQCLLRRGAKHVHAVDVGYNQLDYSLRIDKRVIVHERQNIMDLEVLDPQPQAAVADLSFRSIARVTTQLFRLISGDWVVFLVKPQFELENPPPDFTGVVTDDVLLRKILVQVYNKLSQEEVAIKDIIASPLRGRKGNREFFVLLERSGAISLASYQERVEAALQFDHLSLD